MNKVFEGIRVLELANVLAGPSVGQFFAECGAQVIKIENPASGGDVTRSWKLNNENPDLDISAYFSAVNSGKLSLSLDLNREKDNQVLMDLVKISDIIIVSYKPGDAEKLGLDAATLHKLNQQLIYAQITGYGEQVDKVGYDAIIQAESGFMYMNGEPGGPSLKMPVALIDILAAHQLKEAILLAFIRRMKENKGAKVEVSLIDTAISSLANQATNFLIAGHNPQKMGAEHPNIAPYGSVFTTKDNLEIVLAVGTDKQFQSLCKVLKVKEIANDRRFATNTDRVRNRHELNTLLKEAFLNLDAPDTLKELAEMKIPAGKLQSVADVFQKGEADHILVKNSLKAVGLRNFIAESDFSDTFYHIAPPPALNQHQELIFRKILQYSEKQISGLK